MLSYKLDFLQITQASPSSSRYKWRLPGTQTYTEKSYKNLVKFLSCRQASTRKGLKVDLVNILGFNIYCSHIVTFRYESPE